MVSLMNRLAVLVSPRAWFLNTTSSSHLHKKAHKTQKNSDPDGKPTGLTVKSVTFFFFFLAGGLRNI